MKDTPIPIWLVCAALLVAVGAGLGRSAFAADGPDDAHRAAIAAEQQARYLEQIARHLERMSSCGCPK